MSICNCALPAMHGHQICKECYHNVQNGYNQNIYSGDIDFEPYDMLTDILNEQYSFEMDKKSIQIIQDDII